MKRDLAGLGYYPLSGPLFIKSFNSCALRTCTGWGVPLPLQAARGKLTLLGEESSPFPPLVDARVKRTLPFWGSLLLLGVLRLATRKECTLPVSVPFLCLPHVLALFLHVGLVAVPVFL